MERVMSELAGFFCQKNDLEVHLILYGNMPELFYAVPANLKIHIPGTDFNKNRRFLSTILRLFYLRQNVKKINPEAILSFGELWNSFVLIGLLGLHFPVYISDRCSPEKKFSFFHSWLRKLLYPGATGIIAQTNKAKELYSYQFKHNNIKVIGNPIREISRPVEARQNVVLMVGRLIRSKNQDKLIKLFLNLNSTDWSLVLVGYDHLQQYNYESLIKLIREHNAEQRVFLEGKQYDVDYYYRTSKIFAFTSSSEGFPNAIGEAMSAGLATVAFDCIAGPSEMIKDGLNGFLVPLNDYAQFQEKLEILMNNEDLRASFGRNAQEDIKKFSVNDIGNTFLQFMLGIPDFIV